MLLSDNEILSFIKKDDMKIEPFDRSSLQPASYDCRIGKHVLISGMQEELDMEKERTFSLKAGAFALMTTLEKVTLSGSIAGHIGMKSYYVRKGLILLSGLQIDPGFDGHLVLGMYNASPRTLTLDYQGEICSVDFYSLSSPVSEAFKTANEFKKGVIPRVDKDYLRLLETETLSEMSESVRQLSANVSTLTTVTYKAILPLLLIILAAVAAIPIAFWIGIFPIG